MRPAILSVNLTGNFLSMGLLLLVRFSMPLYTYIMSFKGSTYAAQGSYSNFKGFVSSWSGGLPDNALPGLTPSLKRNCHKKHIAVSFFRARSGAVE